VFATNQGNNLVAEIANTQLNLNQGESFRQDNPMPGIDSVVVNQVNANSVRVTVSSANRPVVGQVLQSGQEGITLGIRTRNDQQAANSASVPPSTNDTVAVPATGTIPSLQASQPQNSPTPATTTAQIPAPRPVDLALTPASSTSVAQASAPQPADLALSPPPPTSIAQTPPPTTVPAPQAPATPVPAPQAPAPDVLVPTPEITIDGIPVAPAGPAGAAQPIAPAPPFLPRAIAPPVGDIAISNINASSGVIDLGTGVRVPRLVLREAPVREVLALLARSAGLNLAYTDGGAAQPGVPGAPGAGAQQTISLDLENEPVQDVFNYVLQISGLQANRVGRTIFVGSRLPDGARNLVARTLRLNQVPVGQAVGFLISQGAEQQQITTQTTLTVVGEGAAAQRIQNTQTQVQRITPQDAGGQAGGTPGASQGLSGALVLRGLSISPDERLNAITLVGEPRKVEIASALLTQLDLRRRQVAVNVKIVDVNLQGLDAFNASFSFGIGDSFFVNDAGAASFNYGGFNPPTQAQVSTSTVNPPIIPNPFAGADIFLDPNNPITLPDSLPDTVIIDNRPGVPTDQRIRTIAGGSSTVFGPSVVLGDPTRGGITDFTRPTDNIITINADGTTTATQGQRGQVTFGLPSLFQFPKKLLFALQAQITSGNAKILTDPTLVVQEGQTAVVNLTQEVFGGTEIQTQTDPTTNLTTQVARPIIKRAGLILPINVQRIDDNGFVTMVINPTVSAIGGSADTPGGTITLVNDRQLYSGQIRLRDGQTLILSGIIQEADRTTVRKVPILGDIPILGALFRSTQRENVRQEVIVLLTPQIIEDSMASSFGYTYTPGRETRQFLQQRGVNP
jgi:type IV pilus assembly protein PilQ